METAASEEPVVYANPTYWEITRHFFIMGWIAFGGPAAHIGLFQRFFVERYKWFSAQTYLELFAVAQCMPGPTSTQVSFAIGTVKKGVLGGILSGIMFQYPGAIIMTAAGAGAAAWLVDPPGWLSGIVAGVSATGVAMIATAAKGLLTKACADNVNAVIGTLSAAAAIYWIQPWLYPLVIVVGGLITLVTNRNKDMTPKGGGEGLVSYGVSMLGGGCLIALWLAVLIPVLILARTVYTDQANPLNWFEAFYRIGSIIYGGGQVVLPMLRQDMVKYKDCYQYEGAGTCAQQPVGVGGSWMTEGQFYAGLGIVQAMPGPLFNFSAYLGAIIATNFGYSFILGAVLAWFGLFGPGVLLMFGVLPFWNKFRNFQLYRRALPGLNAAGVGLILASVFTMIIDVYKISPFPTASLCIGLFSFTAVDELHIFEPFVVAMGAVLGLIANYGKMY
ncbi:MAG: hypothetical protein WDW36_003723 [Sanguina aurantia]